MILVHVEDNPHDAELVEALVSREWPDIRLERVDTRAALESVLGKVCPDIILSDFSLPSFDGLSALAIARKICPDTPFIFLSGTIGEEVAVEALKNGAIDYVLKDRMGRLVPAIQRALAQSAEYSRRRKAEEELKHTHERIREQASLLDKARDAICVTDLSQKISYWNASAEALFGWSAAEAIGQNSQTLLFEDEPVKHQEATKRILSEGSWEGEIRLHTKSGNSVVVESRWTLVTDAAGKAKSILLINTDITERKRLEVQFLRAQRMESIGTLAGGIAHDLNNVLTPILVASQVLHSTANPDDKGLLETIEKSALHGAALIKQVLLFARGADGERSPMQVRHLIAEMEKLLRETFPRSIDIRTRFERDLWLVKADATQLNQVLMNLCVNARDAMPNGGAIEIGARNLAQPDQFLLDHAKNPSGAYVVLYVQDSGTGIPPAILERIWDPFFTTKEVGRGTGLGLSTVVGIVKSHEGAINVLSKENEGTRFDVYLPAVKSESAPPITATRGGFSRGEGEGILVIDDEPYIRDVVASMLRYCGYRSFLAVGGASGIDLYQKHRDEIALVLVDMMMPGLDGTTTMRLLRDLNPDLRIIAMSGMLENASLGPGSGLENVELLAKPITAETLLSKIAEVLNKEQKSV